MRQQGRQFSLLGARGFDKRGTMKISIFVSLVVAPLMAMAFVGYASTEDASAVSDYPTPNRADHAAKLQDTHSKYIRNQY